MPKSHFSLFRVTDLTTIRYEGLLCPCQLIINCAQAHACYDFVSDFVTQPLVASGTYKSTSTNATAITITPDSTSLSYSFQSSVYTDQAGALLSFNSSTVVARFGISMLSASQACANAEAEVPSWDWDSVQQASVDKWEDVLSRVQIDTDVEDATIVELLYSSVRNFVISILMVDSRTRLPVVSFLLGACKLDR